MLRLLMLSFIKIGLGENPIPPPKSLACGTTNIPGQLAVQATVMPSVIDMVSFMVARADDPERWPFLQYSVLVGESSNGIVKGNLNGLVPGHDYLLMAMGKFRNATTSYYKSWSDVTHKGGDFACPPPGGREVPIVPRSSNSNKSEEWIEVWRHHGNNFWSKPDPNNNITLPDYIETHNSADLRGMFGSMGAVYANEMNSSVARYCIKRLVPRLENVTTPNDRTDDPEAGGFPSTSSFADYLSCASGQCFCMAYGDRMIKQPKEQLRRECPGCTKAECMCHCPEARMKQSDKYIGMVPTSTHLENGKVIANGHWFSHPEGGYCHQGTEIGENGCTYKLSPLSHSLSLGTLMEKGVFKEACQGSQCPSADAARKAFAELGVKPCGEGADEAESSFVV